MEGKLHVFGLVSAFLDMSPNAQAINGFSSNQNLLRVKRKPSYKRGKGICKLYI